MNKTILLIIVFFVMVVSYKYKVVDYKKDENNNENVKTIKVSYNDEILTMNLEDYVVGVVSCEVPASFNDEALKAMSVAARTFALYKLNNNNDYVMKSGTSDQCFIDINKMKDKWGKSFEKYYNKIRSNVLSTKNEYLTYDGNIIISFYFAISNGYTENCENVFSQNLKYLKSVKSDWDKKYNYKENKVKFKISDFFSKLGISDKSIKSIKFDKNYTNRVNYVYINNKKIKGTKFRTLLSLRSTDFEITYDDVYVYIKTKGYGHGVGMSQYGANEMAKMGYNYNDILKYYYNGVELMNNL